MRSRTRGRGVIEAARPRVKRTWGTPAGRAEEVRDMDRLAEAIAALSLGIGGVRGYEPVDEGKTVAMTFQ